MGRQAPPGCLHTSRTRACEYRCPCGPTVRLSTWQDSAARAAEGEHAAAVACVPPRPAPHPPTLSPAPCAQHSAGRAAEGEHRQRWRRRLHHYLDWLFHKDSQQGAEFAELQASCCCRAQLTHSLTQPLN